MFRRSDKIEMMKARSAGFDNRRRPQWWSFLLSLFVALLVIVPPSQLCALMELAPSHSHSDKHSPVAALSHSHSEEVATHVGEVATLQSVPEQHACCSEMDAPAVVASALSRFAAPDANSVDFSFMPATLPTTQDTFALTNCHGRDGPSLDTPLRSQFSPSSLLGRAPPVSV